jgi:hypothetical protein
MTMYPDNKYNVDVPVKYWQEKDLTPVYQNNP